MLPESKTGNVKMFPRSTIQEANRHLQALYKRVDELEAIISKQHQQQLATESAYKEEISDLNLKHEEDVSLLEQRIQDLENQVDTLSDTIHQKDSYIDKLACQCQQLETILGYQSSLRELLHTMESSSINSDHLGLIRPVSENSVSLKNGDIENSSPFPSSSSSSSSHKPVLEYSVTELSDNDSPPLSEHKRRSLVTSDKEYYL